MIRKIVVINSKGGCGKTTLSTNLASFYAANDCPAALLDYDPQESSLRWLAQRSMHRPGIHGIAAARPPAPNSTRAYQMRVPPQTARVILDTPASLKRTDLIEILRGAAAIVVPVLPSIIDSRVTGDFLEDLNAEVQAYCPEAPIALVANRVRRNTRAFHGLLAFLDAIGRTPVASLRDSQNYVNAAEQGVGIHELPPNPTRVDRREWQALIDWLEAGRPEFAGQPLGADGQRHIA